MQKLSASALRVSEVVELGQTDYGILRRRRGWGMEAIKVRLRRQSMKSIDAMEVGVNNVCRCEG